MIKSRSEILNEILTRLQKETPITNIDPGSVARTFSEVLSEKFYEFYNELEVNSAMSFVSTANGRYLDLLGQLLNCKRELGESDSNYRARITQQVYVVAGANRTAIRLKALAVDGVKDIILKEYSHGTGSFSVFVITEDPQTPMSVLNAVEAAINDAKGFGIYAEVKGPVLIPMEIMVRLVFSEGTGVAERSTIRQNAGKQIEDYARSLTVGDTFIINELIEQIMDASPKIRDLEIYSMKVNGVSRFVSNLSAKWDERMVLDVIEVV